MSYHVLPIDSWCLQIYRLEQGLGMFLEEQNGTFEPSDAQMAINTAELFKAQYIRRLIPIIAGKITERPARHAEPIRYCVYQGGEPIYCTEWVTQLRGGGDF